MARNFTSWATGVTLLLTVLLIAMALISENNSNGEVAPESQQGTGLVSIIKDFFSGGAAPSEQQSIERSPQSAGQSENGSYADQTEQPSSIELPTSYLLEVPFAAQAPNGNWDMPYQEACEEASLIMVYHYWQGTESLSADSVDEQIVELVDWEEENGYKVDVNAAEAAAIAQRVYDMNAEVYYGDEVTSAKMKELLFSGYPVILPVAGQLLGNPNFTGAGPPYHMIVVVGYDQDGFITHDPGTSQGAHYHYSYDTIENAMHDWTGSKEGILYGQRAMVILSN